MKVKVEVLYAPTCASHLMWLEKLRRLIRGLGGDVILEGTDVWENPEALRRYWGSVWPFFRDGYIHYFILVAVNGRVIDWYWDVEKVAEAVREEMKPAGRLRR